jgi:hypothetical protein
MQVHLVHLHALLLLEVLLQVVQLLLGLGHLRRKSINTEIN